LSTTNPTWPDVGSNSGRRGGKPATNHMSYGTAFENCVSSDRTMILETTKIHGLHWAGTCLFRKPCNSKIKHFSDQV
jgi:hypothetical protein